MTVFKASINEQWLVFKASIHYQKEDEPNPDNRVKIVQWTCVYISLHKTTFETSLLAPASGK